MNPKEIRIGVDTGGTFTDFVIFRNGKIEIKKILSTPDNPSRAILQGLKEFLGKDQKVLVIHGTTVATNSLLERKGGKIALITTHGFEDILFIGRQTRPRLYSLKPVKRVPLLSRRLCFGIEERISSRGEIEKKISRPEVHKVVRKIRAASVQAVAVSLLHSYANSIHEEVVLEELEKEKILSSLSSKILPEYREFERSATTAVNAYLMPVMDGYIQTLEEEIKGVRLWIMQSNEGYISPSAVKREPIRTTLSGPAGGVVGAFHLAKAAGFKKIITFDMGGTSTDVSLVDGQIRRTSESIIGDFPIRIPIIDIHSVGAGGGSIASVDRGGALRVGPESAGAIPGPACYGKGKYPTVTDANLLLGRLDPDFFLGGEMKIFPERSWEAFKKLGERIHKTPIETAEGVVEIANANMEKAIRVISIERGFDPRNFALFSFGGAGGMHAVEIASHLRISEVLVPKNAGVLSALGLILADAIKDYSRSILRTVDKITPSELESLFSDLERISLQEMNRDGFARKNIILHRMLDLRYLGQSYEITIPFKTKKTDRSFFLSLFHKEHQKLYAYHHPQKPVEIVNIRIKAVAKAKKIPIKRVVPAKEMKVPPLVKKQEMFFRYKKHLGAVYNRAALKPGMSLAGPCLVIDCESTTFLPPGYRLFVDDFLNLIIPIKS